MSRETAPPRANTSSPCRSSKRLPPAVQAEKISFRQMEEKSKSGQSPAEAPGEPKSLLPEKYGSPESSDLKAVVPGADPKAFEFDLQD